MLGTYIHILPALVYPSLLHLQPDCFLHKLGAVYISLPCIPPEYRSTLNCIFVSLLFHSDDRKFFTNEVLFKQLIQDFNELAAHGIYFNNDHHSETIYFQLALIQGDNLGVHQLIGHNESFNSTYPCRLCSVDKETMHTQIVEDKSLIRTVDSYDRDLIRNAPSQTGIKEKCVFNDVNGFHATASVAVDLMHDILEGVAHYDMTIVLHHIIFDKKYLSVADFNSILTNFNYGIKSTINKPPPQRESNLRQKKISMLSSEMLTFLKYFGVMFGEFIPESDDFWQLYVSVRAVLSFVLSKTLPQCSEVQLTALVRCHNKQFLLCSGEGL